MNTLDNLTNEQARLSEGNAPEPGVGALAWPTQTARLAVFIVALAAVFALPLIHLTRFSWDSLLFSYIPFVPFMSASLIGLNRERLPQRTTRGWTGALFCLVAGLGLLAIYWATIHAGANLGETQRLAFTTTAFLLLLLAAAFFLFGADFMRAIAFPVAFCFFVVPFPNVLLDPVIQFLRTTSIWVAHAFLLVARTPSVVNGTTLVLPNTSLEVTPECSGFHAAIALILTALFAGHLFLRSAWHRLWFALAVVPLGVARNGFRIFVLSEMCVHQGPQALESPIHSQGGKLFFALSLIPLFLFLVILHKAEKRRQDALETAKIPA